MDTIYYTLNSRRVKVAGGPDMVTLTPVARQEACPAAPKAGEILDLDLCRKRMETKNAWKALSGTAAGMDPLPAEEDDEDLLPAAPRPRRERYAGWLELGATAAVILAALSAALAFLATI